MTPVLTAILRSNAEDIRAPPIRCKQVPRGWCAPERTDAEFNARWQDREDVKKQVRSAPTDRSLPRSLKATTQKLKRTRAEDVQRFFDYYIRTLEGSIPKGAQFGFYKHIKGMDVERKRTYNSQNFKDEGSRLLRDNALIRERWVRSFHILLKTKSPALDQSIVDELQQCPPGGPLDDFPSGYK